MICDLFGIHSKSIYNKKNDRRFYKKPDDQEILNQIKAIISLKPTYGYKRVTAMVNKLRSSLNHNKINR